MPFGTNDEVIFGTGDEAVAEDAPLPRGGGPQRGRKYVSAAERADLDQQALSRRYRDTYMGEANARAGVLDLAVNSALNLPTDLLNSGANLLAGLVGRPANFVGIQNNWEADARSHGFPRIPLLTDAGRKTEEGLSNAMPDWLRNVDPAVFDALNVAGAKGLGDMVVSHAAAPRVPMLPGAAETMADVAARPKVSPTNVNPGQAAALYGLDVSPVELQHARPTLDVGGATQFMERAGGPGLGESRALANAPRLNAAAAAAADLGDLPPGNLLTEKVFDRAKAPHEAVYDRGREIPDMPTSKQYAQEIGGIGSQRGTSQAAAPEIERLQADYAQPGPSAQLVQDIKVLRRKSSKNIQTGAPDKEDIGYAQRKVADALENELARRAITSGDIAYASDLANARRSLAKIYTVEDATWADHLDLSKLVAARKRGALLTGDLAVLADVGERLPRSMRHTLDVAAAPSGTEASAAGIGGMANRLAQNLTRRAGGQKIVNRFNSGLRSDVEGRTAQELFPQHFQPQYDFDPRLLGENFGPDLPPPPVPLLPAPPPSGPLLAGGASGDVLGLGDQFAALGLTRDVERAGLRHPGAALRETTEAAPGPRDLTRDEMLGIDPVGNGSLLGELQGASPRGRGPVDFPGLNDPPEPFGALQEADLAQLMDLDEQLRLLGSGPLEGLLPPDVPGGGGPWTGGGGAPPARPYALDLQELQDALGIREPLPQQEFPGANGVKTTPESGVKTIANNASGQTDASLEALSALSTQRPRFRVNTETGERTPLPGLEARDPRAYPGEIIVEQNADGSFSVVDRGGVPGNLLRGILERARGKGE